MASNPCQTMSGYGDLGGYPTPPAGWTLGTTYGPTSILLASQTWQGGYLVPEGYALSLNSGGEGAYNLAGAYAYPEGAYPGGARHSGPENLAGVAGPGGDFDGNPVLSLTLNIQSLAIKITTTDVAPAWAPHDTTLLQGLRTQWYTPTQLGNTAGNVYVWFCFNDTLYPGNSGCFSVNLETYSPPGSGGTTPSGPPIITTGYTSSSLGSCYDAITVTLINNVGNVVDAGVPGQTFILTDTTSTGTFSPSNILYIPATASTGSVLYTNSEQNNYSILVTPSTGPLFGVAAQTVICAIQCAPSDPNAVLCNLTRPPLRDAIRRKLSVVPPVDTGYGNAGEQPQNTQSYPNNTMLNQAIADAIREINMRTEFHDSPNVPVTVPSVTAIGVQGLSLTGWQGCTTNNVVNTVRRAVWFDATNPTAPYRLIPIDLIDSDRQGEFYDDWQPNQPLMYYILGYSIYLVPGSQNGGTLNLWFKTAVTQFVNDNTVIDQLPLDYQKVIEDGAAWIIAKTPAGMRNFPGAAEIYEQDFREGIALINGNQNQQNEQFQGSFSFSSYRWPNRRTVPRINNR